MYGIKNVFNSQKLNSTNDYHKTNTVAKYKKNIHNNLGVGVANLNDSVPWAWKVW